MDVGDQGMNRHPDDYSALTSHSMFGPKRAFPYLELNGDPDMLGSRHAKNLLSESRSLVKTVTREKV